MYLGNIQEAKTVRYDINLKSSTLSDCISFVCNDTLRTNKYNNSELAVSKKTADSNAPNRGGFKTGLRFEFANLDHN